MRVLISLVFLFFLIASSGCSYYGQVNELTPDPIGSKLSCGKTTIELRSIPLEIDKSSHAFLGIPVFPSFGPTKEVSYGRLTVDFKNWNNREFCEIDDLVLKDIVRNMTFIPKEIWKSKVVHSTYSKFMSCAYKFDDLGDSEKFVVTFRNGFLGCDNLEVNFERNSRSGYHMKLLQ